MKLTLNFNHSNSVSKSDVIFHNLSLCYKGNCLSFPDWLKYGIMYVGQVVDENNKFISYNQVKQLVKDKGCLMFQYNALKQALSSVSISSKTQERKFGDSKLIRSVLLKKKIIKNLRLNFIGKKSLKILKLIGKMYGASVIVAKSPEF